MLLPTWDVRARAVRRAKVAVYAPAYRREILSAVRQGPADRTSQWR
jgi:hypothetical protein